MEKEGGFTTYCTRGLRYRQRGWLDQLWMVYFLHTVCMTSVLERHIGSLGAERILVIKAADAGDDDLQCIDSLMAVQLA